MRIVLDYVANHISHEHPAFRAAQQDRSRRTRFPGSVSSSGRTATTPFWACSSMPRLATDDDGARAYLIDNACRWLARGADGFRLDHAHGATHAFWSAFRAATRAAKPDSATFGEITDTPPVVRSFAGRMDGALDFGLLEALRSFFAFHALSPSAFDRFLRRHFAYFGRQSRAAQLSRQPRHEPFSVQRGRRCAPAEAGRAVPVHAARPADCLLRHGGGPEPDASGGPAGRGAPAHAVGR